MEKKILGILPKSPVNVLLASLVVTYIVALIWSWVMAQSFSADHYWVTIIELLLLAAVIGGAVGMFAGEVKQSTLWIAAGFAALGYVLVGGLIGSASAGIDGATLGALGGDVFSTEVSAGMIVLGIVAAAVAAVTSKAKM
jgi:hypothetical protein